METDAVLVETRLYDLEDDETRGWESLADRVGTVFSSRPSFARNVARALTAEFRFVAVRREGRLVACAPLTVERRGPFRLAKLVGTGLGVPLEFLSEDAEASDALLDAIAAQRLMLSADSVVAHDRTLERLGGHASWVSHDRVREHVPVISLPPGRDASHLRSDRSLKRLRQYRRELAKTHSSFDIEIVSGTEHLVCRWPDINRVAAGAVRGTDRVNYLASPHGGFAGDFLREEADAGRLCIAGLVIDGEWTAHEIGIRTRDRLEGWLTHYDADVGKWQPGHQLIEWFANNHDGLGVVDLDQGVGVNAIKSAWSNSGYDVKSVSAVPEAWVMSGLLLAALRRCPLAVAYVRRTGVAMLARLKPNRSRP